MCSIFTFEDINIILELSDNVKRRVSIDDGTSCDYCGPIHDLYVHYVLIGELSSLADVACMMP